MTVEKGPACLVMSQIRGRIAIELASVVKSVRMGCATQTVTLETVSLIPMTVYLTRSVPPTLCESKCDL